MTGDNGDMATGDNGLHCACSFGSLCPCVGVGPLMLRLDGDGVTDNDGMATGDDGSRCATVRRRLVRGGSGGGDVHRRSFGGVDHDGVRGSTGAAVVAAATAAAGLVVVGGNRTMSMTWTMLLLAAILLTGGGERRGTAAKVKFVGMGGWADNKEEAIDLEGVASA